MKAVLANEELISLTAAPGVQYIFTDGKNMLHDCAAGIADLVQMREVDAFTTFNGYSVTKTITAAAILQLVSKKLIALDDTVNPLFPEFPFSHEFTVRQLLAHQSGIGNPLPLRWIHLAEDDLAFDERKFTSEIISKSAGLKFAPGSKMSYSNVGYMLLGLLIEKISGIPYRAYVAENILKKAVKSGYLGFSIEPSIHATGYIKKYSIPNLLLGLMIDKNKLMQPSVWGWATFRKVQVNGSPYGGLIANAQGLMDYLLALLNYEILDENLTKQLFTEQKNGMCLGWFKGRLDGNDYVGHAGGGGGYYCEIRIYPTLKICSVMMSNVTGFIDKKLLDKLDSRHIS